MRYDQNLLQTGVPSLALQNVNLTDDNVIKQKIMNALISQKSPPRRPESSFHFELPGSCIFHYGPKRNSKSAFHPNLINLAGKGGIEEVFLTITLLSFKFPHLIQTYKNGSFPLFSYHLSSYTSYESFQAKGLPSN